MSWFSSWLHPGRGYADAAAQHDKYYNQAQGYQQPYNTAGQGQIGTLNKGISELTDPQTLYDKWSKGYKESEAAKQMEGLANEHGLNAASSLGLMGSSPALQAIQAGTSGIVAQDKQQYMQDLMDKYNKGMGFSQNMYNTGATTAGQMGTNAMTQGGRAGETAFGQANAGGSMFGQGAGMFTKLIQDYLTGGMGKGGFGRGVWSTGGG